MPDESGRPGATPRQRRQARRVRAARWELLERIDGALDPLMALLSLLWVALLAVELSQSLPLRWTSDVYRLDSLIWLIFLGHFLIEFALAPSKTVYLRRHWLTAISVVLPFFRLIRILRVVRLLRTLSLARILLSANRAIRSSAVVLARHRLGYVGAVVLILALLGAGGVYFFEQGAPNTPFTSYGEAFWWAATMVTTVNVGAEPVTTSGRAIAFLLRIVGLALFSYITASVASYLIGEQPEAQKGRDVERDELRRLALEVRELRQALEGLATSQEEREKAA